MENGKMHRQTIIVKSVRFVLFCIVLYLIITVGIIEGEMILKRKAIIFYEIERVTFYGGNGDCEGFLKDFIGI